MLAPYVTQKGHPEFMRNQTGFGYMVYDIARAVAKTEQVDVLASDSRGEAFTEDNVHFLGRSYGLFFKFIGDCLPINVLWKLFRKYRITKGSLVRLCYYGLISGYYRSVISKGHYDIVHIHGCGFSTELWIELCQRCGQKFLVTLHGLNSFSDTVHLDLAGRLYERDFLKRVVAGEFPITVISTGMKRLIEKTYGIQDSPNISVVCNSFSTELG